MSSQRFSVRMAQAPNELLSADDAYEQLYSYNNLRWLWDAHEKNGCRYTKFNLPALVEVAEKTVSGSRCVDVFKYMEGSFNKAFLMTMEDGSQVVAKIPNPNAGRPHYTTASEAATLVFLRDCLGIPVPKVLAYSSKKELNDIGTEYIIIEKAPGVELRNVWNDLKDREKIETARQLSELVARIGQCQFSHYGALYFADDIPEISGTLVNFKHLGMSVTPTEKRFAIGPTNDRRWFDDHRIDIDMYRGPWNNLHEFISAEVQREMTCIRKFNDYPKDKQLGFYNGPNAYTPTRHTKLSVLEDFTKIVEHVLPNHGGLLASILWHNDLHAGNIFVDPENPTNIVSIIDWQTVPLAPLFTQANFPRLILKYGTEPEELKQVPLPENFELLDSEEKHAARRLQTVQKMYHDSELAFLQHCPDLQLALANRHLIGFKLAKLARDIFNDGEPEMRRILIKASKEWRGIVGVTSSRLPRISCPLAYSVDAIAQFEGDYKHWERDVSLKAAFMKSIHPAGWDGAIASEIFEETKSKLENGLRHFLSQMANSELEKWQWLSVWPFQDSDGSQRAALERRFLD
ncbi:phosphotransferase enzyme family protein [Lineolata rhizophorae]|uniref:Altered inheritance of mitochondria protein 9, mitochondrial n=1 Tax=Lineolata rhizophorae TaxID=578093 RepID=A0A6A6P040_9PEZI|nr:phosphotransferase enzyme family protein [Lineolata rhizophorae]